jgi:metalloendopeptidase OMA1, mitochondrial
MQNRFWLKAIPIAVALLVMLYQFAVAPNFTNPETGRTARLGLSAGEELALGAQSFTQVVRQAEVVDHGPDYEQVVRVSKRLATAVALGKDDGFEWQVAVVRDAQVNAFCLPGGKICVYTGILPITRDDTGLAVVLGHEMAHATSHHGAERVFKQNLTQIALLGAQGAMGDMDHDQRRALMGLLGAGAQYGVLLPFSRDHESEADHVGLLYLARAGYDPRAAVEFWKRMAQQAGAGGSSQPEFMSTHPLHETRIRQIQELLPAAITEYEKATAAVER